MAPFADLRLKHPVYLPVLHVERSLVPVPALLKTSLLPGVGVGAHRVRCRDFPAPSGTHRARPFLYLPDDLGRDLVHLSIRVHPELDVRNVVVVHHNDLQPMLQYCA